MTKIRFWRRSEIVISQSQRRQWSKPRLLIDIMDIEDYSSHLSVQFTMKPGRYNKSFPPAAEISIVTSSGKSIGVAFHDAFWENQRHQSILWCVRTIRVIYLYSLSWNQAATTNRFRPWSKFGVLVFQIDVFHVRAESTHPTKLISWNNTPLRGV